MDFTSMYRSELRVDELDNPNPAYRRGLQRGFEGAAAVPDAEHDSYMHHPNCAIGSAYRDGLSRGQNLRICCSLEFGTSERSD